MQFQVDPAALRAAAAHFDAHAEQLDATGRCHDRYSNVDWSNAGLVQQLNSTHHELVEMVEARLRQAADLLRESATGLRQGAEGYDHTDRTAAAALDAVLPSPWPALPGSAVL